MTWNGCELLAAGSGAGVLFIMCAAGHMVFRRWGNTFAEAAASSIISSLMILSFLFQISFILGTPALTIIIEWGLFISCIIVIFKYRVYIKKGYQNLSFFRSKYPFIFFIIIISWVYLLSHALISPQPSDNWNEFFRVLLYQHQETFFLSGKPYLISDFSPPLNPVNTIILNHLFLGKNTELGIGILGFLAYASIGFSTYALARRYSWPPTALIATLIVISMPRFIYMSTSAGLEIIPAATALYCILMIYRGVEKPNIKDLCLFILGLFFIISGDAMSLLFPVILIPLACVVLFRRHGVMTWLHLIAQHKWLVLFMILPIFIFSQTWLFIYNFIHTGTFFGSNESIGYAMNQDGIQGAIANMVRYLFEIAHFTQPINHLSHWMADFKITGFIQGLYDFFIFPILGNLGSANFFKIQWIPNGKFSWFGPFAFILVLPAMGYSLKLAPRRLKAVTLALVCYFFLISLITAWLPLNVRFFSIFFSCSGFCVAFFLPPWRFTMLGKRIITVISMFLVFYASVYLSYTPYQNGAGFVSPYKKDGSSVELEEKKWTKFFKIKSRSFIHNQIFGDDRIDIIKSLIPPGKRLGFVFSDPGLIYPFLKSLKNEKWLFLAQWAPQMLQYKKISELDYLIFIDNIMAELPQEVQVKKIWQSDPKYSKKPGMLLQVTPK